MKTYVENLNVEKKSLEEQAGARDLLLNDVQSRKGLLEVQVSSLERKLERAKEEVIVFLYLILIRFFLPCSLC